MQRSPATTAMVLTACLLAWIVGTATAESEAASAKSAGEVSEARAAELIAALGSREFAVRRDATRRLADAGPAAIPLLLEAARNGSLEVNIRAVSVLQEMYLNGDETEIDAAEEALETLSASPNRSVAGRADFVLKAYHDVREQRALAAFRKLGGHVEFDTNRVFANPIAVSTDLKPISQVRLATDWQGGDDGLKHLKRVQNWSPNPILYVIDGCGVTDKGLEDLQAAVPQIILQRRGRAFLGIRGGTDPNGRGCQVVFVEEGSAAEKAEIQSGDIIAKFKGKDVPDFETLIDLIGTTNPGDKVKAELLRDFQTRTVEIEMAGWRR